ncbi:MAG TPA: YfiR family protein [Steroidobacteraceae bacterium]|nr:YfiR family protein [Steroidobacteraceae bacterium]
MWRRALACLAAGLLAGGPCGADPAPPSEYQVKAVFLYNFSHFVSWPPSAFSGSDAPLVIAVIGKDPFGANLDAVVQGERVGTRALAVRRYRDIGDIRDCQILFIGRSEAGRLADIVRASRGHNILTVSDIDGATAKGVMIGLVNQDDHIRMQINIGAARAEGLTLSSKLLRPAEIVSSVPG